MIYDKLFVGLMGLLAAEEADATNARIARYVLTHAHELGDISVKALATACHVGTGSVSRFVREAGFGSFAELREAFVEALYEFERLEGANSDERGRALSARVVSSIERAAATVDSAALSRLVADLASFDRVSAYGFLKAQAAALDLQADMLMQGRYVSTCVSPADQIDRIERAHADELVLVFSYTGSYFDAYDLRASLTRRDRPKIWMVCGSARPLPPFVADCLLFSSDQSRFGHPCQLEYVAALIAQEYAARCAASQ